MKVLPRGGRAPESIRIEAIFQNSRPSIKNK